MFTPRKICEEMIKIRILDTYYDLYYYRFMQNSSTKAFTNKLIRNIEEKYVKK